MDQSESSTSVEIEARSTAMEAHTNTHARTHTHDGDGPERVLHPSGDGGAIDGHGGHRPTAALKLSTVSHAHVHVGPRKILRTPKTACVSFCVGASCTWKVRVFARYVTHVCVLVCACVRARVCV